MMKQWKQKLVGRIVIGLMLILLTGCTVPYEENYISTEELILELTIKPTLSPTMEPIVEENLIPEEKVLAIENSGTETTSFSVTSINKILYPKISLNVRTGPGVSYEKIGTVSINQNLQVTGVTENNWYEIDYNGEKGYCSGSYLSEAPVQETLVPVPAVEPVVISNVQISDLLTVLNADRVANGFSVLTITSGLQNTAGIRVQEIATLFSHIRPNGMECFTAFPADGATAMAENIYMFSTNTTAAEVEAEWMNSPGHRANILNAAYTKVGIGIYQDLNGVWYFVQDFSN